MMETKMIYILYIYTLILAKIAVSVPYLKIICLFLPIA